MFWDTKRRLLKALSCSDVVSLNIYMILLLLICLGGAPVFLTNDLHCSFIKFAEKHRPLYLQTLNIQIDTNLMTESCYSLLYFAQHIGCCHLLTSKVSRMWLLVHNKVYFCYNLIFHCTLLSRPNQFYWHVFTPEHHLEESLAVCSCLLLFSYYSSCMFYQLCTLWRQSRGRVTFGVQWLVATGKQRIFPGDSDMLL